MTSQLTKLSCAIALVLAVISGSTASAGALSGASGGLTCDGAWHIVASANPASSFNELLAVSAASPSVAWAVGWGSGGAGVSRGIIERWDGTSWTGVFSPAAGHQETLLTGVSAPDAGHAFAVGGRTSPGGRYRTLVEQFDGVSWSIVPSVNRGAGYSTLNGVSALSGSDAWAVGVRELPSGAQAPLVEHWNGSAWSYVPSPFFRHSSQTDLIDVAAIAPNDVWAVGTYYSGVKHQRQLLTEHWNGTAWSIVPAANPGSDLIFWSLTALAADDVWAVGVQGTSGPLAEHWDGSSWSVVPLENPGIRSEFLGVAAAGSSVFATGVSDDPGPYNTLAERLEGSAFQRVMTPNVNAHHAENWLRRAASDGTTIWSVGYHDGHHSPRTRTLVEYVC
jgi:hypothetical protein